METFRISVSLSVSLDLSTFLSVSPSLVDFTFLPPFHFVAFPTFSLPFGEPFCLSYQYLYLSPSVPITDS